MTNQCVPILVYHHVYREDTPDLREAVFETGAGIIGEAEFRRQMEYVAGEGWTVVSTTQIVDWLSGGAGLQEKAVALHFDNGWLDTATVAMPMLRQLGMTATCFPITDGVDAASGGNVPAVRTLTEGVVEKPFMNWDQTWLLLDAGWEIGAHTRTHCKMADKHDAEGDEAIIREVESSNDVFKSRLGFVPDHFAYPSGSRNKRCDELLSPYYRSLRLWHFEWPISWTFTTANTPLTALDCQNIDLRVSFEDFKSIFSQALAERGYRH